MSVYLIGAAWMVVAAAVTAVAAYGVRNFTHREGRSENNDAAGHVFTIVDGLYAVLVAFVLIGLFDNVGAAQTTSYQEADSLVATVWAADSLPAPAGHQIHQLAIGYADQVVGTEWSQMADDQAVSGKGWNTLNQMHSVIVSTTTTSDWENDRRTEAANQLWSVFQDRQQRLNDAGSSVSAVMWFALIIGGLLALAPPLLFGGPKIRAHIVLVSTLAATLALLVYAIYQLQNPFAGSGAVGPDAFRSALDRLK